METAPEPCLVFLDVDGVLNSTAWFHTIFKRKHRAASHPHDHLDPTAMGRLNRVLAETGGKVVVSSTWRMGRTVEELQDLFDLHGFEGEVIGKTGHGFNGERGLQIREWMRMKGLEDVRFIAIDDDTYDMGAVADHLVHTDNAVGLQDVDVDKAIAMLTGAI